MTERLVADSSMPTPIITVEKLSKRYVIGHQRNAKDGLRHTIEDAFRNPIKWLCARKRDREAAREEFWALENVSFEVKQGEVVGIIGRNGAGKSTLLKILSRITEPTQGRISLRGRVASLLEVGTGFHQELTGRENIFLNGAILGMSQAEIRRKFDEIVTFSEIEKFLDTPVKRYSSGMYVRLAFAVAAHLEPEILIVDEVLAVGDGEFQKKCMGKMDEVARCGRTILFVSHNMGAIRRLCQRAVLLESGRMLQSGPTETVLSHYLSLGDTGKGRRTWTATQARSHDSRICLRSLRIVAEGDTVSDRIGITSPMAVELEYELKQDLPLFRIALRFVTADGTIAFTTSDSATPEFRPAR